MQGMLERSVAVRAKIGSIGTFCRFVAAAAVCLAASARYCRGDDPLGPSPSAVAGATMAQDTLPPPPAGTPQEVFSNLSPADELRLEQLVEQSVKRLGVRSTEIELPHVADSHGASDHWPLRAFWKHGLTIESEDEDFKVHIGGRSQFDTSWFGVPGDIQNDPTIVNRYGDGVDFRRLRIKVDGSMHEFMEWAFQVDFVNSVRNGNNVEAVTAPTDLWWAFTNLPHIGNIRVGNHKEPIGFEHLVSSRFLPFMERSFNQDAFTGGFNNGFTPGISAYNTAFDQTATWTIGLFKPTNNVFVSSANTGDYAVTGRLTWLPIYQDDGERLVHFGFSARQASSFNGTFRIRTRSAVRSGLSAVWPLPADTGTFPADDAEQLNGEFAAVYGPWTVQADYLVNLVNESVRADGVNVGTAFFHGGYVQVFYYLTGEHDNYNRKNAVFDRVIPHANVSRSGSLCPLFCGGAWQVGLRYNYLDLTSQGINGGVLNDVTAGINWFLNPNLKLQWNYSATHRESGSGIGDGWIHGFGMRLAQDF